MPHYNTFGRLKNKYKLKANGTIPTSLESRLDLIVFRQFHFVSSLKQSNFFIKKGVFMLNGITVTNPYLLVEHGTLLTFKPHLLKLLDAKRSLPRPLGDGSSFGLLGASSLRSAIYVNNLKPNRKLYADLSSLPFANKPRYKFSRGSSQRGATFRKGHQNYAGL